VPPKIVDFRPNPPLFSVRSGNSLTLLCRAEGTPTPNIRWRIRDTDYPAELESRKHDNHVLFYFLTQSL